MNETSGRRSVLSVPGDDPRKIAKALDAGADEVVIDLEDAVAPDRKAAARDVLRSIELHGRVAVRVNAVRTPWCHLDLMAVAETAATSVVLPKTESRADVGFAERLLDGLGSALRIQALVETARGVAELRDIVRAPERLTSLIIGYADLAASLGRSSAADWRTIQEMVLVHGKGAGLEIVDGPYLGVSVDDGFVAAATGAAAMGFDAKWAIHPRQLGELNRIFAPSPDELAHARRVLEAMESAQAAGVGAIRLDNALVDEAMALAARRVLAKAGA